MKNRKYTRKSLRYKWKMFWYQLTLEDIINAVHAFFDGIFAMLSIGLIFAILFIVPHFFH